MDNVRGDFESGLRKFSKDVQEHDRNGAAEFQGRLNKFGSEEFPNWERVVEELMRER